MKIWHLKNCDTCRKAIKALQIAGTEMELIDVRQDGVSAKDLRQMIDALGIEALVNKRSTTWRGLSDAVKSSELTKEAGRALLTAHPTLIKRPVILAGQDWSVGWTTDVQSRLLPSG